jgi:hypothetical protein
VKSPKKSASFFVVGQMLDDPALGRGTVDSIVGQTVVATFGGQRYQTTLSALGQRIAE